MLRAQLDTMERDERALRTAGHKKLADQHASQNARMRRKVERTLAELRDRMAAADACAVDMLQDLITELERSLAEHGATSSDGMPR
jgi:hypothetical protein